MHKKVRPSSPAAPRRPEAAGTPHSPAKAASPAAAKPSQAELQALIGRVAAQVAKDPAKAALILSEWVAKAPKRRA
jgi:hypothetical protein